MTARPVVATLGDLNTLVAQITAARRLSLRNSVAVARPNFPNSYFPAGTPMVVAYEDGSFQLGPEQVAIKSGPPYDYITTFLVDGTTRRIWTRSLCISEQGDPGDLILRLAGPDNTYPGVRYPGSVVAPPAGLLSGSSMGQLAWIPWYGIDVAGSTGGTFADLAVRIWAETTEPAIKRTSDSLVAQGARLLIATRPNGYGTALTTRLIIDNDGRFYIHSPEWEFDDPILFTIRAQATPTSTTMTVRASGDGNYRWQLDASGTQQWSDGTHSADVTLARGAAGQMALTGDLSVSGNVGGAQYRRIPGLPSTSNNTNAVVNAAAVWAMQTSGALADPSASGGAPAVFYLDPADYAIAGKTTKLRLKIGTLVNDTAPGNTMTWGLYPVGTPAGGSGILNPALGTVVAGSTVAQTTPAANAKTAPVSSGDFTIPAAGFYMIGMASTGAMAANSKVATTVAIEVRNV